MSKRRKCSAEEKLQIVNEYLSGHSSLRQISKRLGYASANGYPGGFADVLT